MSLDKTLIRELAELLVEADLTEIEVTESGRSIRVARQVTMITSAAVAAPALAAAPVAAPAATAPAGAGNPAPAITGTPVTSPMVGTAYLAPEPGAPTFVKAGDRVSKGQTLLIVEAMKTMNPIPAPRDGVVQKLAVENGQPVEYGEILVVLE
ncbi:acetyl-CoA carboxylase biotin carboxyl carrier protein [Zavarzinia aquatilis]|uniref:Biotin carboxyl carrier protein of acetyl-CoA carboxylase n=2 Tax=Zavarzinia aquatilis TaxID=2211142 RepID=A0A317EKH6_9PROT|nr:acetyl-CoA carboxylase biotin carboxyl carrier protein [Zavarzinia aquatilis]PWR25755.1 acetyl-CoA carboxylase biotin carboxyl carrier protein [Zavarzinia aquatilis]